MYRKKRQPAPFFKMPGAPFNPATGENALLGQFPSKGTTLALFQVVAEDTHDNYVECRGYEAESDTEFRYLHDPYTVPTTTPINVAKPYAIRGTKPYKKGQVIVAARIKGKLGYNQGKAATTVGQPADLNEAISLLTDDDDVAISWLDVGTTPAPTTPAYWNGGYSGSSAFAHNFLLPTEFADVGNSWNITGGNNERLKYVATVGAVDTPWLATGYFKFSRPSDFYSGNNCIFSIVLRHMRGAATIATKAFDHTEYHNNSRTVVLTLPFQYAGSFQENDYFTLDWSQTPATLGMTITGEVHIRKVN